MGGLFSCALEHHLIFLKKKINLKKMLAVPGSKENTDCFYVADDVSSEDYTCQLLDFKEKFFFI